MINSVVIMGRLTADPELKTTNSGRSVTSFCVAVDRPYQKDGKEREADFINVVAWRQTAEFVTSYFSKGSMIAVQGSIQTRKYTDRNGNNRTSFEIVADNVSFCGSKSDGGSRKQDGKKSTNVTYDDLSAEDDGIPLARLIDGSDDDLPF